MKQLLSGVALAGLLFVGCTQEAADPAPSPDVQETDSASAVAVPDVISLDLRKAVNTLQGAGLTVDLSALSKSERGYATGQQTHPRVWVVEMDPPPGTEVEEGTSIVILKAECPRDSLC